MFPAALRSLFLALLLCVPLFAQQEGPGDEPVRTWSDEQSPIKQLKQVFNGQRESFKQSMDEGEQVGGKTFLYVVYAGFGVVAIATLILLIVAFRTGLWWGVCSLLIPGVLLIFIIANWDRAQRGVIIWMSGLTIAAAAFLGADQGWFS